MFENGSWLLLLAPVGLLLYEMFAVSVLVWCGDIELKNPWRE